MLTIFPGGVFVAAVWPARTSCRLQGGREAKVAAGAEAAEGGARYVKVEGGAVGPDPQDRRGAVFDCCGEGVFRGEAVGDAYYDGVLGG